VVRLAGTSRSASAGCGYDNKDDGMRRNQVYGPQIKSPDADLPQISQQDQSSVEDEDS